MKKKTVSTSFNDHWYWLYSLVIVLLIISPSLVLLAYSNSLDKKADQLFVNTVQGREYGIPKRLQIPTINVDAEVESVGITADGAMDIPVNADNVAWYNLGVRPGEQGSAVIDGHLDKEDQSPAVFANLGKLAVGDVVSVYDGQENQLNFRVIDIRMYLADDDTTEVFSNQTGKFLNLITCAGSWDAGTKDYNQRRVIFTELIQ